MRFDKKYLTLYVITDKRLLNGRSVETAVEEAVLGGATMVQLREKTLTEEEFVKEAISVKKITQKYGVPLIINDNVSVCQKADADGVHLGQSDMPPLDARKILGSGKIIGVSAKTPEQAIAAQNSGADYLGVGAAFSTLTKEDAVCISRPVYKKINAAVSIPVAAIGGINAGNIAELKSSGISGIAVVGAVFGKDDIMCAAKELKELSRKYFYD